MRPSLDNGVKVVFERTPGPLAAVTVMINAGSRHDPPDLPGLHHALEHIMHRATARYPTWKALRSYIDSFCTEYEAVTDGLRIFFQAETDAGHIRQAVKLLAMIIKEPVISAEHVRYEQGRLRKERQRSNDSVDDWIEEQMDMLSLPPDLGHTIDGPLSVIEKYTAERLRQLYRRIVVGQRLTIIVTGNFNPTLVETTIRNEFGSIRAGRPAPAIRPAHRRIRRVVRLRVDETCEQVNCSVVFPTMPADDPDRLALEIIRNELSQRRSSRVVSSIDALGLTYTSSDKLEYFPGIPGQYSIQLELEKEEFLQTLRKLPPLVADLCISLMSPADLRLAKKNICQATKKFFGQPMKAGDFISRQLVTRGSYLRVADFLRGVRSVTRQRIRKVSRRIFTRPIVIAHGPLRGMKKRDIREALRFRKHK